VAEGAPTSWIPTERTLAGPRQIPDEPASEGKPLDKRSVRTSAGILLWRRHGGHIEVLLGHPGGPYFARKDSGYWTVLKGEAAPGESLPAVARREFAEETGRALRDGPMIELGAVRQRGGKVVVAWAIEGDLDPATAVSNTFEIEWPPRSGRTAEFPEIDRVAWLDLPAARAKINAAQTLFLERLERSFDEALPHRSSE
jgi:predicted NUDIX family NTP pyrophosphohydrolase